MEAPVLAYQNSEDVFILDTDASNHSIGAELLQVHNGVVNWFCQCCHRLCATILLPGKSY